MCINIHVYIYIYICIYIYMYIYIHVHILMLQFVKYFIKTCVNNENASVEVVDVSVCRFDSLYIFSD